MGRPRPPLTAASASRRPAGCATCGASRTRPWPPSSRCTACTPTQRYAAQAAQAAFDLADRLERELSRFLPNSDVARINRLAAGEATRVGDATMECLVIARHVFDLTGGAFDVVDRHRAAVARTRRRRLRGPCGDRRCADRPRGHRQGLCGRPDGRTARGVGNRAGAGPRRIQLRGRARGAGGSGRVAPHVERPRLPFHGARPSLGRARRRSALPGFARAITSWTRAPAGPSAAAARPGPRCPARNRPAPGRGWPTARGSRPRPWPMP